MTKLGDYSSFYSLMVNSTHGKEIFRIYLNSEPEHDFVCFCFCTTKEDNPDKELRFTYKLSYMSNNEKGAIKEWIEQLIRCGIPVTSFPTLSYNTSIKYTT